MTHQFSVFILILNLENLSNFNVFPLMRSLAFSLYLSAQQPALI